MDRRAVRAADRAGHDPSGECASATARCPMPLLTIKQAAERLNVCPATVYDLCAQRKLAHHRVGVGRGTIRIDEADLAAFMENCKVSEQSPRNAAGLKHIKAGPAGSPSGRPAASGPAARGGAGNDA